MSSRLPLHPSIKCLVGRLLSITYCPPYGRRRGKNTAGSWAAREISENTPEVNCLISAQKQPALGQEGRESSRIKSKFQKQSKSTRYFHKTALGMFLMLETQSGSSGHRGGKGRVG